jgi:hypothetical protein
MYMTPEYRIPLTKQLCEEINIDWNDTMGPEMAAQFKEIFNNLPAEQRRDISNRYRK